MSNPYGPWATLIDAGGNPQLSSFWRRRLTMLVPTSQTSAVLSRRNLLWLGAAAVLMIVLPTFRAASVAAEDDKMASENSQPNTTKAPPTNGPPAGKQTSDNSFTSIGIYTTRVGGAPLRYLILPVSVGVALSRENTRKGLQLTGEQETKLREISQKYLRQRQESGQAIRKEMEKLSPEERIAKQTEFQTKSVQEAIAIRRQVEELLTAEQLTAVKCIAIGLLGAGRLMSDPQFREKVGVTEEQKETLSKRLLEDGERTKKPERLGHLMKMNEEKMLAVITPQQWEQIEQIVGTSGAGMAAPSNGFSGGPTYPGPEWQVLGDPNPRKELGLSAEQQTKLDEISAKTRTQSQELSKLVDSMNSPLPAKERQAKHAEFNRKLQEIRKLDRQRVEALLTKHQLAMLKRLTIRRELLNDLFHSEYVESGSDDQKPFGIFEQIKVSKEQMKELRRLNEEKDRMVTQSWRETGETALKILSPQQQEKLFEELEKLR
jgi:hypothetical protein